ncbi:MAG: cupin domain-containing protein [Nanoarchaeota archaeon]
MKLDRTKGFISLEIRVGKMYSYNDGNHETEIYGFTPKSELVLLEGATYFGFVSKGKIKLLQEIPRSRERILYEGDFFSVQGAAKIISNGLGIVNSSGNYLGFNVFGGPIEEKGKLRYIDGCTDTLLVPPVRIGDPCLNHLHFPPNIVQTPHTHPSIRTGLIYKGRGECIIPGDQNISLTPDNVFIIKTDTVHSFNTNNSSMDVISYHPDSDVGMTDSDHPMINRTLVDGISASKMGDRHKK